MCEDSQIRACPLRSIRSSYYSPFAAISSVVLSTGVHSLIAAHARKLAPSTTAIPLEKWRNALLCKFRSPSMRTLARYHIRRPGAQFPALCLLRLETSPWAFVNPFYRFAVNTYFNVQSFSRRAPRSRIFTPCSTIAMHSKPFDVVIIGDFDPVLTFYLC